MENLKEENYWVKWRAEHPSYYKDYYYSNKPKIMENQKKYFKKSEGMFIYMYLNEDRNPLYIGKTHNFYKRNNLHLTGNSNIKMTAKEYRETFGLDKVIYADFNEFRIDDMDLDLLENIYKEDNPQHLITREHENTADWSREEELRKIMAKVEWKEFEGLDKYLND